AGGRKLILVFTQERLHLLANILNDKARVDLLVVDEAHKIGDNQRGVVLQDAVERISRANPQMRVVFISAATQNPEDLLDDAPGDAETLSIDSDVPTVLQNVVVVEQVPRKPKKWVMSLRQCNTLQRIGVLNLENKAAGLRKRLAFIASADGASSGTLICTNVAAEAEGVDILLSQLTERNSSVDSGQVALAVIAQKDHH